jgi:peptidyl-prolyl cis-trans isomerase D
MLQMIREKITGWIAVTIVTLLIIPFALWGVNSYFEGGTNILAAKVNGKDITLQEYQRAYQNLRQQYQANSNGVLLTIDQEDLLKQQTIENLVLQTVQTQANESAGMRVSDVLLGNTIRSLSYFQGIGGFDNALYESVITQSGLSSTAFEDQMREDLTSQQFQYAMLGSAFLTGKEVEEIARLVNQTRDISYAIVSSAPFKDLAVFSDTEIENYYQQQSRQFTEPEKAKISYVELSLAELAKEVVVDEASLREYYDTYRVNYEIEEQRSIEQIYIATGEEAEEEDIVKAREQAASIYENIQAGQSLEEAASSFQEDEDNNIEIGNYDFLTPGIMDPEVDEVIFAMNEGDVSEPVENASGLYINRLTGVKGGKSTTFEEMRDQMEIDFKMDQSTARYAELADEMTNLAFENPDTLEFIQEDLGIEIKVSNYFGRDPFANNPFANASPESILEEMSELVEFDQITSNPNVIASSFSDDILINSNNSDPIEIEENRLIVLRVDDYLAEKIKPLGEVRDQIVNRLKLAKSTEETQLLGEGIIAELNNNLSKEELAEKHSLQWEDTSYIKRNETDINPVIIQTAFSAGKPTESQPVHAGASLASGDYAVVIVHNIEDTGSEALNQETLEALKAQLGQQNAQLSWNSYVRELREKADVEVFSNNL